jgi:hypothetical protein
VAWVWFRCGVAIRPPCFDLIAIVLRGSSCVLGHKIARAFAATAGIVLAVSVHMKEILVHVMSTAQRTLLYYTATRW